MYEKSNEKSIQSIISNDPLHFDLKSIDDEPKVEKVQQLKKMSIKHLKNNNNLESKISKSKLKTSTTISNHSPDDSSDSLQNISNKNYTIANNDFSIEIKDLHGVDTQDDDKHHIENLNDAIIDEKLKQKRFQKSKFTADVDKCLEEMIEAHKEDINLINQGFPAIKKLSIIKKSLELLDKSKYHKFLIENPRFYDMLGLWLEVKPSDKILPNLTIRTALIKFIKNLTFPIPARNCKHLNIGKSLKMMSRHKNETDSNRKILLKLLDHWYNELFGINQNYISNSHRKKSKQKKSSILSNINEPEIHEYPSVLLSHYNSDQQSTSNNMLWHNTMPSESPRAAAPKISTSTYSVMPYNDELQNITNINSNNDPSINQIKQSINRIQTIRSNFLKSSKS